jgi:hypothetical protein
MRWVAALTLALVGCTQFQDGTLGSQRFPMDATAAIEAGAEQADARVIAPVNRDAAPSGGHDAGEHHVQHDGGASHSLADASASAGSDASSGAVDAGAGHARDAGKDASTSEHCMREPWECP